MELQAVNNSADGFGRAGLGCRHPAVLLGADQVGRDVPGFLPPSPAPYRCLRLSATTRPGSEWGIYFLTAKRDSLQGCASLASKLKIDTSVRLQRFVLLPRSSSADERDEQNGFWRVFVCLFVCYLELQQEGCGLDSQV